MRNKLLITLFILVSVTACEFRSESNNNGGVRQLSQSIQRDEAEVVKTNISMKAGKLTLKGGAENLVDTDITSSREDWQPTIDYTSTGKTGRLRIEQPDIDGINFNFGEDETNNWVIQLNDDLVQDLDLQIGAGETEIDLRGLTLNSVNVDAGVGEHSINLANTSVPELDINAGVGEVSVDLSGKWNNDLDAEINGGIGELNLLLPNDIGIRVEVSGALGAVNAPELDKDGRVYTNALYGESEYLLTLEIKAGIGTVNISLE
ncbi:toast rack family protein [Catalinimonas niigatensis]|uniref:toast rack family protein n=1 Tax=Catalinimonas niigatensis TaxID=1397264 RepID=UPI002665FCFA|nr:toast rack family protein [Catalinimonas niigatensis]WPP51606.1 toast rack family protein [Catalinimonas niigatensis]